MRRFARLHIHRSFLAYVGAGMLLVGLASVIADGAAAGAATTGANFVATGHDMDFHCAGGGSAGDQECAYLKIVVGKVRNGSSKPILALDHGNEVKAALALTGQGPVTVVDPDNATALNAVDLTNSSGTPNFSAIIVASDATCGGCDNDPTGEANINARKADIKTFFNGGGGILALAGAENRDLYYDFVPLSGLTSTAVTAPFTVTSKGAALGITSDMANCCATHNSFELPAAPLVTLETDTAGKAETIAAFNVKIGGGGFTSPPPTASSTPAGNHRPSSSDMSITTFINTPVHVTLVGHDPDGDSLKFTVKGRPDHGVLTGTAPNLTYTPDAGFLGHDFFTFVVSDGRFTTIEHVVNISVIPLTATSSPPPLANTGSTTSSNLNLGFGLLGAGVVLLALGLVRRPQARRGH